MPPRLIYLNIGNTHTEIACGPGLASVERLGTRELLGDALPEAFARIADPDNGCRALAACVVPTVRERLTAQFGQAIHFVGPEDFPQIDFSAYDISTLGADRAANAAQAWEYCHGPVLVIDCGTAINTELIDGHARFLGGVILPGRAMQRRALHEFTAQLPLVPLTQDTLSCAAAKNTRDAISLGIDCGCLGAVRELARRTRQTPGLENCRLLAIGGDAEFFLNEIRELEPAPPHFTLRGLLCASPRTGK